MSKEYIEREAILEQIIKIKNDFSPTIRPMFDVFKHMVSETPAADVAPVVHAKWRKVSDYWTCSNCCTVTKSKDDEYCRHCGAKMKED